MFVLAFATLAILATAAPIQCRTREAAAEPALDANVLAVEDAPARGNNWNAEAAPAAANASSEAAAAPSASEESAAAETPAPSAPAAEAAATNSGGSSGSANGDATYYAVGLGACGWTNSDSEMVVAINAPDWAAGKHCGQYVQITGPAGTQTAKVVDLCPGCASGDLDMSPDLFEAVMGDKGIGRAKMDWSFTGEVDSFAAPNAHALAGLQ